MGENKMIKSLSIHSLRLCRQLPYTALLSAFAVFSLGASVQAQEGEELEEVTVTGSRIVRRDYVSNSPIVTVETEQFEQQSGLNIESYLNQLPEYNPAASPVTTQGDVQITPINSVGIASISLRGFGPNRSLVLIDGKRPVPVNPLMVQDINGVPSALIQRVETITGGASAVYGADAVGGVTNFILRKDYEGFEFDGQYGISEAGDGEETRISALFGANFADDRGNVTFGLERYEREAALAIERDAYTDRWANPDAPGFFFFVQGTNAYSCSPVCPTYGAYRALFGGQNPSLWVFAENQFFPGNNGDSTPMNSGIDIQFNPDGSVWTSGFPFQTVLGQSRSDIVKDGLQYANRNALASDDSTGRTIINGVKWNNTQEYVSAPQDRYSIFSSANFDVTDEISVFAGARFTESRTRTLLFGTNAISGWETSVPYNPTIDSPINPAVVYNAATLAAVEANPATFFAANPNPNFIPTGSGTFKYCQSGTLGCTPAVGATSLASKQIGVAAADPLIGQVVNYHPVPVELAWLLNSRTPQNARWQPQWNPDTSLPPRNTYNTIQTWQIEAGVNYEFPFRDWTGELYFSHGESATYNEAGGNLSLSRYRSLANAPDYGAGATGTGNQFYAVGTSATNAQVVSTIRPAFGVGDFKCTSGLYNTYFGGDQPLSGDCFNAINAVLQTRTEMVQEIIEVNLQGGVIDLPAGEARAAMGYQHRQTDGKFNPDILQSSNSFTDQVVGVYPTGYLGPNDQVNPLADTTVDDFYIEALIPVVEDLPYMQKFEIETGARYSSYEETDNSEWTYKILGNWEVKDWLRLRGGYNRATRSPNLGELFLNEQEIFTGGGNFGDPCSIRANAPWGAGGTTLADDETISPATEPLPSVAPGQTQAGADRTKQICDALMGTVASNQFYQGIVNGVDSAVNFVQQGGGGGFAWVLQKGNPLLEPEKADTWTAGFVMNSPLENPWLSGITLSFDWYMVNIEDAIMTYSIDYANYRCFGDDTGLSAAAQAATPACLLVPRDQFNGAALSTTLSYDNQATIETSGFDIAFNWSAEIASLGLDVPGSINLNMQTTVLNYYETKQSPAVFDVLTDWKGSLGPNLPGTQAGAYDYRIFTALTYSLNDWSATLRWRNLPSVWTATKAGQLALIDNNTSVTAGGPGIILGYTPSTEVMTDSYNIFDLAASWNVSEMIALRAGITNLLDEEPPYVGTSAGYTPSAYPDATSLAAVCGGAPGCSNPTAVSLPSIGGFNGGYYDTLGRRFFVGLKVSY